MNHVMTLANPNSVVANRGGTVRRFDPKTDSPDSIVGEIIQGEVPSPVVTLTLEEEIDTIQQSPVDFQLQYKWDSNMPTEMQLRQRYPMVSQFARFMREQLWLNHDKGDQASWSKMGQWQIWNELQWHSAKLSMAIKEGNNPLIIQYSADCANIAMFLLDNMGALRDPMPF